MGTGQSDSKVLHFGVPQGSVLGPNFFYMYLYMQPLAKLIKSMGLDADDSQLYMPVNLRNRETPQKVIAKLTECSMAIKTWVAGNSLKLNDDKAKISARDDYTSPRSAPAHLHRHLWR